MFEGDFPKARVADVENGGRVIDCGGSGVRQPSRFARQPDERTGIEEQVHSKPRAFIPASSSGANESSFQPTGAEVISPTCGRRCFGKGGKGTIRATASAPFRRITSSPCSTQMSSWARCVSAYWTVVSMHVRSLKRHAGSSWQDDDRKKAHRSHSTWHTRYIERNRPPTVQ